MTAAYAATASGMPLPPAVVWAENWWKDFKPKLDCPKTAQTKMAKSSQENAHNESDSGDLFNDEGFLGGLGRNNQMH